MMDDTGVQVITGMRTADGWRSETIRVRGRAEDVFVSPAGLRYVKAMELERADLIARVDSKRFAQTLVVRLRLEQGSALAKKSKREQKLIDQGEEARNRGFQEAFGPDALPNDALKNTKPKRVRRKL